MTLQFVQGLTSLTGQTHTVNNDSDVSGDDLGSNDSDTDEDNDTSFHERIRSEPIDLDNHARREARFTALQEELIVVD